MNHSPDSLPARRRPLPLPSRLRRAGAARVAWVALLLSAGLLAGMAYLLLRDPGHTPRQTLTLFCAAGIRPPVDATLKDYLAAYDVRVNPVYGGSNELLTNLQVAGDGDLYLAADESYLDLARQKGLIAEVIPLARMTPRLAVTKGNPKGLRSLDDLLKADPGTVKIALARPESAAIGKVARDVLSRAGQWEALAARVTTYTATVNASADAVKTNSVDAAIIWDALGSQYPQLDLLPLPQFEGVSSNVSVAVLKSSKQPTEALKFARFLAARDKGLVHFREAGYTVVEGDKWAEAPELHLLGGAMLRPALEQTVKEFEQREGARVTRVYNGCGILVSQMKAGEHPDIYFACDVSFMIQVKDLFHKPEALSQNQLVLIVPRANPHGIKTVKDLARPGVRVGIGHEKQCALGALTETTLKAGGVWEEVSQHVATRSPTGDFLVNQLKAGGLDAVIAYVSNAASAGGEFECYPIDLACATATQPVARGKESDYPQLTGRLIAAMKSEASKRRFEGEGFTWVWQGK